MPSYPHVSLTMYQNMNDKDVIDKSINVWNERSACFIKDKSPHDLKMIESLIRSHAHVMLNMLEFPQKMNDFSEMTIDIQHPIGNFRITAYKCNVDGP